MKIPVAHLLTLMLLSLSCAGCAKLHMYKNVSGSMSPSINAGDHIFVDQTQEARTDLHDGDIILLHREADVIVVKRILALPGETISGTERKVFRDGKQVEEPYCAFLAPGDEVWMSSFPARKVAPGEIFVMGDNRDYSLDSRAPEYAPVRFSDVVGKYTSTYWHGPSTTR